MAYLKEGELAHKSRWISNLDLMVLLYSVVKAGAHKDIGHEHTSETLEEFKRRLSKRILVRDSDLESALWACGQLNELGEFSHPDGTSFTEWHKGMIRDGIFNEFYNWIEEK